MRAPHERNLADLYKPVQPVRGPAVLVMATQRNPVGIKRPKNPVCKPARECPPDFELTFVSLGRFDCEEHYRARRDTVTRWLIECGKVRLINARAAHVANLRAKGEWLTRGTNLIAHRKINIVSIRQSIRDTREVSDTVARHAAQHLRIMRNGGMTISPAGNGEWWVGSRRLSAAQMVDLARGRGFDDKVVIIMDSPLHPDSAKEVKR
jgi:hypothetical protein